MVENHTVNMTIQWGYPRQFEDLAGMQDFVVQQYGRKPPVQAFGRRPFHGCVASSCTAVGLKAIATWETKAKAGRMDYQYGNTPTASPAWKE